MSVLLHFIPFVIVTLFTISPFSKNLELLTDYPLSSIFMWGFLIIQAGYYMFFSNRTINQYEKSIKDEYSNLHIVDIGWVKWLFHTFVILYVCFFIIFIFMIHVSGFLPIRPILTISFIIIIWILGYRGLSQKEISTVLNTKTKSSGKYSRSSLTKEKSNLLQNKLKQIMGTDKLFLNPELKFDDLVKKLNTSRNDLSYILNMGLNKNFYMFVNEYRINEVIRLMKDSSRRHQKILALAFDSGFNSKPSFNSVFKKITGKTPSAYRKKYI